MNPSLRERGQDGTVVLSGSRAKDDAVNSVSGRGPCSYHVLGFQIYPGMKPAQGRFR